MSIGVADGASASLTKPRWSARKRDTHGNEVVRCAEVLDDLRVEHDAALGPICIDCTGQINHIVLKRDPLSQNRTL